MWIVDFTVTRGGASFSKSCRFYTKYALLEFIGKMIQEDSILVVNVHYDVDLGKRGDK